jgi:hypothetical protein
MDSEILDSTKKVRSWVHIPIGGSQEQNVAAAVERRSSGVSQAPKDSMTDEGAAMEM